MKSEKEENFHDVGELKKRRETMEDSDRYIIYYTFERSGADEMLPAEENENV